MNLFTKSSFCLVDKEYWEDLDMEYFLSQKQLHNHFKKVYNLIGRNLEYREKEPFQYPKFYNYQSLTAFDCFTDQYLLNLKSSKIGRLNYKNLILSVYINTKAYYEGFVESINNFYKKYYRNYQYNYRQLLIQNQFLHKLQSFISQDYDQISQLDNAIEKEIDKLEETILDNQKLQFNCEENMYVKQDKIQKQLISELNELFKSKIVSIQLCQQQYRLINEYPSNRKTGFFNYYKVKFQPDYNKYELYIDTKFIENLLGQNKLKDLIVTKNLENGKYCHICKKITENQIMCKRRIPLPIPKINSTTVQCGKVYCIDCYNFREQRLNMQKKEQQQELQQILYEQNVQICLSCSGQCQCQICLKEELVSALYKTLLLKSFNTEKINTNYYSFYREKIE